MKNNMWELLLSTILGIASGAASAGINNTIAGRREEEARGANYIYGKLSGDDADRRTRALYNDLYSPKAQLNQLKEIGLSPSYYYSSGAAGVSGQSGASNGAAGVQPNVYGVDATMLAQLENVRADTELKKAEANKTNEEAGVVANKAEAEITNLLASANATKATEIYTKSQTTYQNTINAIQTATSESQIKMALHEAELMAWQEIKTMYEADQAATDANTKRKIQDQIIQESINRNANIIADTALKESQKELNEQEKKKLQNDIAVSLRNIVAIESQAETAAKQAKNAEEANEIHEKARKDAYKMWYNDWQLKTKEFNLEKTKLSYEYGTRYIRKVGSSNEYFTNTLEYTGYKPIE